MAAFFETRCIAHVATPIGAGQWDSLCRRTCGIGWPRVKYTETQQRIKPWCTHCVRKIRSLAEDVLGGAT